MLCSGVVDKPDRKLLESCSQPSRRIGRGRGALAHLFFFPFSQDYFYSPSCRWVSLEHGAQNWKGDLKGDFKASLYPRWPLTAPQQREAKRRLQGAHLTTNFAHRGLSTWTCWLFCCFLYSNNLRPFNSGKTSDWRLQQKLSSDVIRSSMQPQQATTRMEYASGSRCNYL